MKVKFLLLIAIISTNVFAVSDSNSQVIESLSGRWNMSCKASKIPQRVTGIVPQWYENSKEINFFASKTTTGSDFLNVNDYLPNVAGRLALPLPVFYTKSGHSSFHTFSNNSISSNGIKNEYHICDIEYDSFGRWGGSKPDLTTFFICSFQTWHNSVITKEITLVNPSNAKIEVKTHFGDPEEDNTIQCLLTR